MNICHNIHYMKQYLCYHILNNAVTYVLVIPQYEYNMLVITHACQVRGEAEDACNN